MISEICISSTETKGGISRGFFATKGKAKILNAELHIIVLPYEFQTRNCKEDDLVPQNKIRNLMEKSNTKFYDFTDDFCKSRNPKKLFYKYDPMHLSTLGHKFVYNRINNIIDF